MAYRNLWRIANNPLLVRYKANIGNYQQVMALSNQKPINNVPPKSIAPEIDFKDTKVANISKATSDIVRGLVVFYICKSQFLVKNNKTLMNIARKVLGKRLFELMMRATFYGHFVAGADQKEIRPYVAKSRRYGVKAILDYSAEEDVPETKAVEKVKQSLSEVIVEPQEVPDAAHKKYKTSIKFADRSKKVVGARTYFYESEAQCDRNMEIFMKCIDAVSDSTNKEGLAAVKLTALGRPQFLLQMSDFLVSLQNLFQLLVRDSTSPDSMRSLDSEGFRKRLDELGFQINYDDELKWFTLLDVSGDGKIDLLDWSHLINLEQDYANIFKVRNKETGKVEQLVPSLTDEGIEQLRNMIRRIDTLASHAQQSGVRMMIDAEQTYFQPAIRRLVIELMRRFNRDTPIIYNTYQCYLKDAYNHLMQDINMAQRENFYFGAKFVRGAYMEQERARANEIGYEDPINPSYEATTAMYERCLELALKEIGERELGAVSIMVATHNEDTVRFAIQKMHENQIGPKDKVICFAQLLGMCDQISYSLGQNGYSVYKYVPYGPVEEVLPYLSRRAQENQSILSAAAHEREMLKAELWRRACAGELFYRP